VGRSGRRKGKGGEEELGRGREGGRGGRKRGRIMHEEKKRVEMGGRNKAEKEEGGRVGEGRKLKERGGIDGR